MSGSRRPAACRGRISLADLEKLFRHLYSLKKKTRKKSATYRLLLRDIAVLELLFATGARVGEVCSLRNQGIDLRQESVQILGKGGRPRENPSAL